MFTGHFAVALHLSRTWPILALGLAVAACRTDSRRTPSTNAPAATVNASGDNRNTDVVRYHGEGFEIELPPGSAIGHGGVVDTLRGPMVTDAGRSPDMGGPGPHPTFLLEVNIIPNPSRAALGVWADSVWRETAKAADEIAEPGPLEPDTIGGEPVLSFEPSCGDCESRVIYVARGDRIVRLSYDKGIHLAGTREQQEDAYRGVLATLRWTQDDGVDRTAAREEVQRRYEAHFHAGQGFSIDTLRARQSWFTPELYRLMAEDMGTDGEIGYIDFDPFTSVQDDAAKFDIGAIRLSHDTVYVNVDIHFTDADAKLVTLAMVPAPNGWAIADFIYQDDDLAVSLRKVRDQKSR